MGVVSRPRRGEQMDERLQPGDQEGTLKAALSLGGLAAASLRALHPPASHKHLDWAAQCDHSADVCEHHPDTESS